MRDHPQQDDGSTDDRARETYPIAELDSQWARMSGRERIQHLFDMQNPTDKRTSATAADAARVPANIQRLLDMQGPRSTDKPIPNGWETPGVKDHPQRPDPENIRLPDDRRTHILDGDPDGKGGGHRYGTGRPGKTEFPQRWDDDAVADHVLSTSRTPDDQPILQKNGRWFTRAVRDGVEVIAIVAPDGDVRTGYPLAGGNGVREIRSDEYE